MYDLTWLSCGLFVLAILVNSGSVYLQKQYGIYNRFGKYANAMHSLLINVFWVGFLVSACFLLTVGPTVPRLELAGWILRTLGVILFLASVSQIGYESMANKNIFSGTNKKLSGVYTYIHEPMYTSFTIILFSTALWSGVVGFYYLSLLSFLGLQYFESFIES